MKHSVITYCMFFSLLLPWHALATQLSLTDTETENSDGQTYRSLVYVNQSTRESIVELIQLFPDHSWSTTYKNICLYINDGATVMLCQEITCVINECLKACNDLSHDRLDAIATALQKYKKRLEANEAHIFNWHNDDEIDKVVTRNFDGSREILQLYTRNLTVDGIETVNGLLTVNGILAINGRIILNGIDINAVIATASTITGLTNHGLLVGNGAGGISSLPAATNGQIPIGSTGADPVLATITAGAGVAISNGPGTIMISSSGGGGGIATIDGNSGSASATTVNIVGTGSGGNGIITTGDNAATLTIGIAAPVSIANGGTNAISMTTTDGTIIYDGTRLVTTATGTANQVLTSNGAGVAPTYQDVSASGAVTSVTGGTGINITGTTTAPIVNLTTPVSIANGGTNATTMATTDGTVIFDGIRLVTTATGTANQVLTSNGAGVAPTYQSVSASGAVTSVTGGTGINITGTATAPIVNLTTPVAIANGGTNATTMATTDGTVIFDGTRLVTTATGTANQVLTSNGAGVAPTYQPVSASGAVTSVTGGTGINITGTATAPIVNLTTPVTVANGGTGAITLTGVLIGNGTSAVTGNPVTQFDVLVGGASNTITSITPGTSGLVLTSNGTSANPTFQAVSASGAVTSVTGGTGINITGTATAPIVNLTTPVAIANGGTNATSMTTTDGTVIFDGTRLVTTATGTANQVLTSNGAGVAPTYQPVSASGAVTSVTGGTGINITGTATAPIVNLTTPVAIANGGTNATSMATTDGTVIFDGTRLVTTATGTANQVLTSNGAGVAPTYQTPAASSISITGDTGGALTGNSFIFAGGTTGLSFNGTAAPNTETLAFAGITANGGTVSLATDATTSTINVGTGAGVKTTTLGSTNTTSTTTLQSGTGALNVTATNGALTINSGTGALGISTDAAATTVSLATGGAVKSVTLGSVNTTSATTVQSGTGALNITSTNGIQTHNSGTGTMNISTDATANAVNVGTGAGVKTTTIGSTNTTSPTTVQSGTGALNVTATNGPLTINSGTGTLGISTDATNNTVNVGTGAGVKTTTLGSTNTTSPTTVQSGTGALNVTSTNGALTINSGTGALGISTDATTTTVNVGTGAGVKTTTLGSNSSTSATTVRSGTGALNVTSTNGALTINSGTGALGISNDAAATTVSLATGAGVKTVTLGSTNTTSTTNLQSGSGGIKIPAFTEGALVTSSAGVISTVTGTAGNVLTANAAGVSPSFQPATGITTINGNTGSITGSTVTIRAFNATGATNEGTVRFTNSSTTSNLIFTDDSFNVGIGRGVLGTMTSATENTALGGFTMGAITSGSSNVGIGVGSISTLQTGSNNVAVGNRALNGVGLTGSGNIGIGTTAGSSLTGSEASNVLIGNGVTGTSGESRAIHLADTGAASATKCFIGGIRGVTTGVNNAIAVLIDSAGQLGTVSSSKRFKENIVPMPSSFSGNLLSLNPTLFNYKQDETKTQTWGLIAEEVQQIFPGLVVNDQEGFPLTVKYHELPVLLLNELIKLKKEVEMLKQERTISSH